MTASITSQKGDNRSTELSQALDQLLGNLDDLERSIYDVMPQQVSALRKRSDQWPSPSDKTLISKPPKAYRKRHHKPKPRESLSVRTQTHSVSPMLLPCDEGLQSPLTPVSTSPGLSALYSSRFRTLSPIHLGPGSYFVGHIEPTRKYSFSQVPRFPVDLSGKIAYQPHCQLAATTEQKKSMLLRTKEHIESLKKYKPEVWKQQIKEKAVKEDFRANISRLARMEIEISTKRKRADDLHEKFRKYEWRMRAEEIFECKRRWVSIMFYLSSLNFLSKKQVIRKVLCT